MYSVQCLGVGRGATNFLNGDPSTAYVLKKDDIPVLFLDMGAGVGRSAAKLLGDNVPKALYISHNHSDHTGDLPVFIAKHRGVPITLLGHKNILDIVREHRLHELPSVGVNPDQDINYLPGDLNNPIKYDDLEIHMLRSDHAYECYGFVLKISGAPILGWTADSCFDAQIYAAVSQAPIAIVHGRDRPSGDHAAFDEIGAFAEATPATCFYVAHYGTTENTFSESNVSFLTTGQEIRL